jgi:hypothetical protein
MKYLYTLLILLVASLAIYNFEILFTIPATLLITFLILATGLLMKFAINNKNKFVNNLTWAMICAPLITLGFGCILLLIVASHY